MSKKVLMPREGSNEIYVGIHHLGDDHLGDLHWHDYYELEILLTGEAVHIYNGTAIPVKRGDAWLMTYYDFHAIQVPVDTTILHIIFSENSISPDISTYIYSHPRNFCCHFSEKETKKFEEYAEKLSGEIKNPKPFHSVITNAVLSEMLVTLIRKAAPPIERKSNQIQRATAYLHKNFRQNIQLGDLAAYLKLSTNYCGSLFKKNFGMSFNDYLLQIRLKHACQLLSTSEMSITEIAAACGFCSIEYFFISFKKRMGITPASYRKMMLHKD